MHDLNTFRNNLEEIAHRLAARGFQFDIAAFRELDAQRRAALTEVEKIKAQVNTQSAEIGKLRKQGGDTSGTAGQHAHTR